MNYYDIKITGKDVNRFIKNLYKMHINFYNMKYVGKSIIVKVNREDYLKIKDIKTIYEIEVVNYYGIAKLRYFLKIHGLFLIILSFGFLLFLLLTNIIFEVEVNHNDSSLRNLILDELKEEGISKYRFVVSFSKKEKIKENILNKYSQKLEWIEIERVGTKYIVEVEERKKNNDSLSDSPRNIVAKKNGMITKIISSHGEIVSKVDQYVKKGDILISGTIHNKEEVVANIRADGKVYAETWYTVTTELPYHYREEDKTGNNQTVLRINWFNKQINLFRFKKYNNSINIKLFNIKNFILPISISIEKEHEVNIKDQVYTNDNAIFAASEIAKKRLTEKLGENIEIKLEKNLKCEENNSKIIVVMFYKVIEDITDYQYIVLEEEKEGS